MSMHRSIRFVAAGLVVAALASSSGAQTASALLREGDPIPGAGAGFNVTSLINSEVNMATGAAITVNTSNGSTTLSAIYGRAIEASPLAVLQLEGTIGTYLQTAFESFFGIDNAGSVAYSPTCTDLTTNTTGLDTVWQDNTPIAVRDLPIPTIPGTVFRFASRAKMTAASGQPYWTSGIDDAVTGADLGDGFFIGAGATPVIVTGDVIPGLSNPVAPGTASFNARFSAAGSFWILETATTAGTNDNDFIIINGLPVPTAAGFIGENQPIPGANGGIAGELWDNFDEMNIAESGEYMFYGDTDGAGTLTDEFIARNGVIVYREGDVIDGEQLTGSIESGFMNEAGDIVAVWDIEGGTTDPEALMLNDKILIREGDLVDLDGDGIVEPASVLSDITGSVNVGIGVDRKIYFTGDVDVNGTSTLTDDIEAWFVIEDPCGSVRRYGAGCPGTGGFIPRLELAGCSTPGGNVTLNITNGLGGSSAILFFGLARNATPAGGGCFVNVAPILPLVLTLPLGGVGPGQGQLSAPTILPSNIPPTLFTMQAFVLDPATGIGGAGTAGLEVTIQ